MLADFPASTTKRRFSLVAQCMALIAMVCLLAACAAGPVRPALADARAERFAALYVQTLPLDKLVESIRENDPRWPLQSTKTPVSDQQLQCVRARLTPASVRTSLHGKALAYAAAHPDSIDKDIQALDSGLAAFMGSAFSAAVQEKSGRKAARPEFTAQQMRSVFAVLFEDDYAALRKALYLDGLAQSMASGGRTSFQSGEMMGARLFAPMLLDAVAQCKVDISF